MAGRRVWVTGCGGRAAPVTVLVSALLCALALLVTGCDVVPTGFRTDATTSGEAFAAAALTLQDEHTGKLTSAYAAASFVSYQSELNGLARKLPGDPNRPPSSQVRAFLAVMTPALQAVAQPCLAATCDWQAQVRSMQRASAVLLRAGGS